MWQPTQIHAVISFWTWFPITFKECLYGFSGVTTNAPRLVISDTPWTDHFFKGLRFRLSCNSKPDTRGGGGGAWGKTMSLTIKKKTKQNKTKQKTNGTSQDNVCGRDRLRDQPKTCVEIKALRGQGLDSLPSGSHDLAIVWLQIQKHFF